MDEQPKGFVNGVFDDIILYLLPLLIKVVQEVIDQYVDGAKLTETQLMALKSAQFELASWGKYFAAQTSNTWDDQGIDALLSSIKDILDEVA